MPRESDREPRPRAAGSARGATSRGQKRPSPPARSRAKPAGAATADEVATADREDGDVNDKHETGSGKQPPADQGPGAARGLVPPSLATRPTVTLTIRVEPRTSWSLRRKRSFTSPASLNFCLGGGHPVYPVLVRLSPSWDLKRDWRTQKSRAAAMTMSSPVSAIRPGGPSATSFAGCSSEYRKS
jgi:hypothetical protein